MSSPKSFVIQPFNARFNKRYEDVFGPAITEAGLEPYRVDRDPAVSVPIETIEKEIAASSMCFCDISEDNVNVWFELGFAIASGKQICLVREENSDRPLPFDVRHRSVIFYQAESSSDFESLRNKITLRVKAVLSSEEQAAVVALIASEVTTASDKLSERDLVCLNMVASNQYGPQDSSPFGTMLRAMGRAGYNQVATQLALRTLVRKEMIKAWDAYDQDSDQPYVAYAMEDGGWEYLESVLSEADMRKPPAGSADLPF